jgi:pilus assembly protein CpaE
MKSKRTTVVILYKSPEKVQQLLEIFEGIEGAIVIADTDDPERALTQISENAPKIALVEIGRTIEENIALIERAHQAVPETSFFAFGDDLLSDIVIRAVNAGVKYFVQEPFETSALQGLLERTWSEQEIEETRDGRKKGHLLTVFSNKGGLGKTTIATNLAVSLAVACKKSVALIDLDLQFGDISIFLDLHSNFTISDLVSRIRELDHDLIQSSLVSHETGVKALTEPKMAEESDLITPDHIHKILSMMTELYDYVVVDTTHSFDDVIIEALDLSDLILLISVLDLPTIRNTQRCLEIFRRLGFPEEKIKLIVNRFMSDEEVDPGRFEAALDFPVYWKIPNDYSTVINAINGGVPILRLAPSSQIARNFNDFSLLLTGSSDGKRSNHRSAAMFRKVFSMVTRSRSE